MFEAEIKALFAKYFQKDKSQFLQCTVNLAVFFSMNCQATLAAKPRARSNHNKK